MASFESMSGSAVKAAFDHVPSLRNPFHGTGIPDLIILVEVSRSNSSRKGEQGLDDVLQTVLEEIWEQGNPILADAFVGPPHEIWALRHALSEGVKHRGNLIAFDLSFRRGDVTRFLEWMRRKLPERFSGVEICDFGHLGDGGVHFNLVVAQDDTRLSDADFETSLRKWVFDITVNDFGGSFSAEHAIGRKNLLAYEKYTPAEIKRIASGLKSLMSPGVFGACAL